MLDFIFFFFSSRRRHTRCSRDWSSDVYSSDLKPRACSNRAAATSDGISGDRPYFTRMRSPVSRWQSNLGAVPPTSVTAKVHSIDFGWLGSESSRALVIGVVGRCHTVARESASRRSCSDTFFDFKGAVVGVLSLVFSAAGESQAITNPQAATITRALRGLHPIRMAPLQEQ